MPILDIRAIYHKNQKIIFLVYVHVKNYDYISNKLDVYVCKYMYIFNIRGNIKK